MALQLHSGPPLKNSDKEYNHIHNYIPIQKNKNKNKNSGQWLDGQELGNMQLEAAVQEI